MTDSTPRRPPPQGRIRQFDTLEEMIDAMHSDERAAMETLHPAQASIGYGEFVVRLVDDILIWGTLFERDDLLADGLDDEDAFGRGYRYGRFYSVVVPEGEEGSAHVTTLWRVRMEDFEKARLYNWSMGEASVNDIRWVIDFSSRMQQQAVASGLATEEGTVEPKEHVYTQTARVAHRCHLCGNRIEPGTDYERVVIVPAEVGAGEINDFVKQHRSPVLKRHVGAPGGCP